MDMRGASPEDERSPKPVPPKSKKKKRKKDSDNNLYMPLKQAPVSGPSPMSIIDFQNKPSSIYSYQIPMDGVDTDAFSG